MYDKEMLVIALNTSSMPLGTILGYKIQDSLLQPGRLFFGLLSTPI